MNLLEPFRDKYVGRTCCLAGKGPSLDHIEEVREKVSSCVFICVNESIHKIEKMGFNTPLHVVQQDRKLSNTCVPSLPDTVHFLNKLVQRTRLKLRHPPAWNPKAVLYLPQKLGCNATTQTAIIGINIAKWMGMKKFILIGFDSWKEGGSLDYAGCIGYDSTCGGRYRPERFLEQRYLVMRELKGCEFENLFLAK